MEPYRYVTTSRLAIGYLEWNASSRRSVVLVHGWPDSPEGWIPVAEYLADAGYRVLCPALRGFAPTRFLSDTTPRSGQHSALGRDLLAFMAALDLQRPVLVGHDWGARAVANACGLDEGCASHLVLMSVGYGTNDPDQSLPLLQARNYWYHWYMATPRGKRTLEQDGEAFARLMWDTWSPPGWYREEDFAIAARAFDNPDWAPVVLHYYRHRWGFAESEPAYLQDDQRLNPAPVLDVPTLMLHGALDACNLPQTSDGKDSYFRGPYRRVVMPAIGHFPHREAPSDVAGLIVDLIDGTGR